MNNTGKEIYYRYTPNRDNKIHIKENNCYSMDVGAVFFYNLSIIEVKSKEAFGVGWRIVGGNYFNKKDLIVKHTKTAF